LGWSVAHVEQKEIHRADATPPSGGGEPARCAQRVGRAAHGICRHARLLGEIAR
jgi:hypothetical protein